MTSDARQSEAHPDRGLAGRRPRRSRRPIVEKQPHHVRNRHEPRDPIGHDLRLSRSVHVGAVVDMEDDDPSEFVVDVVQHAVRPAARTE